MNLAVGLWNHRIHPIYHIIMDSQAAVKAIDHLWRQSGQAIIKELLNSIDEMVNEHTHAQVEIV